MGELLKPEMLWLFVYFVLPGIIGLRAWQLLVPGHSKNAPELSVLALAFSLPNAAIIVPFCQGLGLTDSWFRFWTALFLVGAPAIEAYLFFILLSSNALRGWVSHPTPTAWDHIFRSGEDYWIRLSLKSGSMVGGRYCGNSFTSSFPNPEQIYISEAWVLGADGAFERRASRTAGLLVNMSDCDLLEMFSCEEDTDEARESGSPTGTKGIQTSIKSDPGQSTEGGHNQDSADPASSNDPSIRP